MRLTTTNGFRLTASILAFTALLASAFVFASPAVVHAQNFGLDEAVKQLPNKGKNFSRSPNQIIGRIVSAALGLVGIIFFVLMLYAGFLWMTARGNEKASSKAKEIIVSAVIGLVIVAGAYAITTLIFSTVTEAPAGEAAE